ncbi:MAG TPA: hypothetical protein VED85_08060, partial [Burkholderiaceae bacterium]|nr:hypothetical protein [Burkholderiaceae bacterium]
NFRRKVTGEHQGPPSNTRTLAQTMKDATLSNSALGVCHGRLRRLGMLVFHIHPAIACGLPIHLVHTATYGSGSVPFGYRDRTRKMHALRRRKITFKDPIRQESASCWFSSDYFSWLPVGCSPCKRARN